MDEVKFLENVGKKIASIRKEIGLKQSDLALKIGRTQDAISGYEHGKRSMYLKELSVLAKALNVSPGYLLLDVSDENYSEELLEGLRLYIEEYEPLIAHSLRRLKIDRPTVGFFMSLIRRGLRQEIKQKERQKRAKEAKAHLELLRTKISDEPTALEKEILDAVDQLGIDVYRKVISDALTLKTASQSTKKSSNEF